MPEIHSEDESLCKTCGYVDHCLGAIEADGSCKEFKSDQPSRNCRNCGIWGSLCALGKPSTIEHCPAWVARSCENCGTECARTGVNLEQCRLNYWESKKMKREEKEVLVPTVSVWVVEEVCWDLDHSKGQIEHLLVEAVGCADAAEAAGEGDGIHEVISVKNLGPIVVRSKAAIEARKEK